MKILIKQPASQPLLHFTTYRAQQGKMNFNFPLLGSQLQMIIYICLILSGDVELNPGPHYDEEIEEILKSVESTTLVEDDWNNLYMECDTLCPKWIRLSTYLGLRSDTIDRIMNSCPDPSSCLGEALREWLKQNYNTKKYGMPSWKTFLGAIGKLDKRLLKCIASKLVENKQGKNRKAGPVVAAKPVRSKFTFPFLHVKACSEEDRCILRKQCIAESEDMERAFQDLFESTKISLCKRSIPVKSLVENLDCLVVSSEVLQAVTILDGMSAISKLCSFFNHHMLKHIIEKLGAEEDQCALQKYEEHFQQYSEREVYKCPADIGTKIQKDQANLGVIVTLGESDKLTLKLIDLWNFVNKLQKILKVSEMTMRLCHIQLHPGNFKLTFEFPQSLEHKVFRLGDVQEIRLRDMEIKELSCGDYRWPRPHDSKSIAQPLHKESKEQSHVATIIKSFETECDEHHKFVGGDRRYFEQGNCPNKQKGCKWHSLQGNADEHLKECEYQDVECNFCHEKVERNKIDKHKNLVEETKDLRILNDGCQKVKVKCPYCSTSCKRQDLNNHMKRDPKWEDRDSGCQHVPLQCLYCKGTFKREVLKRHLNLYSECDDQLEGCAQAPITCSYCHSEKPFQRQQYRLHLYPTKDNWTQVCPKIEVKCPYCKEKCAGDKLGEHLNLTPSEPKLWTDSWLDGCDAAEISCIYCKRVFKRSELKKKEKKIHAKLESKHCPLVVVTAFNVRKQWYGIGLKLRIDEQKLREIKARHKGSEDECFYETIKVWLESKEPKTWKMLVNTLRTSEIDLKDEADEIEINVACEDAMMKTVYQRVKDIEEKVNKVQSLINRASELKESYTTEQAQLLLHKREIPEKEHAIERDNKRCKVGKDEVSKFETQMNSYDAELNKAKKNQALYEEKLQEIEHEQNKANSSSSVVTNDNKLLIERTNELRKKLRQLQVKQKEMENTVERFKKQRDVAENKVRELQIQINSKNDELTQARRNLALCKERLQKLSRDIFHCKSQLETEQKEIDEIRKGLRQFYNALHHELEVRLHRVNIQFSAVTAAGCAAGVVLGGVGTAVATLATGPVGVVAGATMLAGAVLAATATAAGAGFKYHFDRGRLNNEQKELERQYNELSELLQNKLVILGKVEGTLGKVLQGLKEITATFEEHIA